MDTLAVRRLANPTEHGVQISLSALQSPTNKAEGSLNQTRTGHYSAIQPFSSLVQIDLEAPFTAERSSLSPLQLIAKASSAALELAETGDMEPVLKVLTQLAKIWK
jgi:hypothetical protein